ncbi:unnamed protein product [Peniophora sp. CBMAI 1063]|nr:unnamed protein product [Peniophora sp. CBMAI 1063]
MNESALPNLSSGEKYAVLDYLVCSQVSWQCLTYDIACTYSRNSSDIVLPDCDVHDAARMPQKTFEAPTKMLTEAGAVDGAPEGSSESGNI